MAMSDQPLNGDFGAPESRGTSQVAVVIPVRDGERYLRETIESVLAQTLVPAEVIVVDDGSTDSSASIAAGYRPSTRVVSQRAAGLPTALNRGVAETTAELVAMLDADDIWPPSKLELQASQLAADPGLDAVFGHMKSFLSPDLDAQEREDRVPSGGRAVSRQGDDVDTPGCLGAGGAVRHGQARRRVHRLACSRR